MRGTEWRPVARMLVYIGEDRRRLASSPSKHVCLDKTGKERSISNLTGHESGICDLSPTRHISLAYMYIHVHDLYLTINYYFIKSHCLSDGTSLMVNYTLKMHGSRVIGFSIISNFINMCLAYHFKINDIYHYYFIFL
jgi:hypothetical protein